MQTQPQKMTEAEWNALGVQLFGKAMDRWRFVCPHCKNVMSLAKARELGEDKLATLRTGNWRLEQECVGRYIDVGCNWAAYGLLHGPFFVVRSDGRETPVFGFDVAEAA